MEILRVSGSHRECGQQIGSLIKTQICDTLQSTLSNISATEPYWTATEKHFPEIAQELLGISTTTSLHPLELFSYMVEELRSKQSKGCTDIVLTPPTTNDSVLVGHNNDLAPSLREKIFAVEWKLDDGTTLFTVGPLGFYVSCGANNYGLALTGNELTSTDNKPGIPRSIIAKAILKAKTIEEAIAIAIHPDRASSYNNIVSDENGSVEIEGSATSYQLIYPTAGSIVHANHYIGSSMQRFEGLSDYPNSRARQMRGEELVASLTRPCTLEHLKRILRDHNNGEGDDDTICGHGGKSQTIFSFTVDFKEKIVDVAMGNPCLTEFEQVWKF